MGKKATCTPKKKKDMNMKGKGNVHKMLRCGYGRMSRVEYGCQKSQIMYPCGCKIKFGHGSCWQKSRRMGVEYEPFGACQPPLLPIGSGGEASIHSSRFDAGGVGERMVQMDVSNCGSWVLSTPHPRLVPGGIEHSIFVRIPG